MQPKIFHPGTKAVFDSFAGLVPCTVTSVHKDLFGHKRVGFQVNTDQGPYHKGETLESSPLWVIPKAHIRRREFFPVIIPGYAWGS